MGSETNRRLALVGLVGHRSGASRTIAAIAISIAVAVLGLATPAAAGAGGGISLDEVTCQDGVPTAVTFIANEAEETQEFDVLFDRGTDVETRPVNWPTHLQKCTADHVAAEPPLLVTC